MCAIFSLICIWSVPILALPHRVFSSFFFWQNGKCDDQSNWIIWSIHVCRFELAGIFYACTLYIIRVGVLPKHCVILWIITMWPVVYLPIESNQIKSRLQLPINSHTYNDFIECQENNLLFVSRRFVCLCFRIEI